MKKQDIIDAYIRIRKRDNTIPDEVLDFMKDAALEKINADSYKTPDSFINQTDEQRLYDLKNGLSFGMK